MATDAVTKLSALAFLLVLCANFPSLSSTSKPEPTISASPGVLPYVSVTAPDISSFFPNPLADGPRSPVAPPDTEGPVPEPSPGGKSSTSARQDSAAAIIFVLLFSLLVTGIVVF